MTANEVIDEVRHLISEPHSTGFYSNEMLLLTLNRTLKGTIIPHLFEVSKYIFLRGLMTQESDLSLSSGTNYDYYDITGLSATPFELSIRGWVDNHRIHFVDVDQIYKYEGDNYEYFRPDVLGALVGNEIRIYDENEGDLVVEYIKIPNYSLAEIIELSQYVIDSFLLPAMAWKALTKEPEPDPHKIKEFKDDYHFELNVLRGSPRSKSNPTIPPAAEMQVKQEEQRRRIT
jgi:hypothetical protein